MAASIKLLFLLLISLSFTYITSEPEPEPEPQRFSLENILDQLKSHISVLESRIDDRTREIRSKDEKIRQMEMIIHEKSKSIDSLMSEIESLQPKGVIDVKEQSSKSYARIGELEKQVQVHGEWFPHWLTVYFSNFQYHVVTHWDEHGRQALDMTVQKVLEKKSQFDKWAEHHTETIYNKWIPMFKDWSLNCISYLWECIPPQTTKCDELFHAWKKTALHHAINVQEMAGPYLKEARKFTQPCINQVAKMTRSLVKRVVAAIRTMIGLMVKWW
ncbi:hypothetical protein POPTR_006G076700v4 [Populus trichocarpa]|uniref:Uncharacterized protein n=1 Tax=Populus trichocarpa TaxID=3694 RepID=A0A2K1ZYJ2_POPTR|nr:hypothetical protein BDE02_06G066600 [Populus trichocarpa]PNT30345.1 hypothetical protein POPTR_006G076700v4 [Populus trichocarpa]